VEQQCFRPLRHGGLGYRKATNTSAAAFIGGFALAAYGPFGIGKIDPELLESINNPNNYETSILQFPSMFALHQAWSQLINNERATTLCKAAVADCLGPQRDIDETDDDYSRRCYKARKQDHITFETAWKTKYILGIDTPSTTTPESLTQTLREIADTQWQNKLQDNLSAIETDRYENPACTHPSSETFGIAENENYNDYFPASTRWNKQGSTSKSKGQHNYKHDYAEN
jgi:hypothetical protein